MEGIVNHLYATVYNDYNPTKMDQNKINVNENENSKSQQQRSSKINKPESEDASQQNNRSKSPIQGKQTKQIKKKRMYRRRKPKPNLPPMQPQINDPNFEWNENQDFVVERIIGQETWGGKKYYLIKWKGFDITLSTWQEASKFTAMKDLLQDFRKTLKGKRDKHIRQKDDIMMNPYAATQVHGHFLYGDEPKKVQNLFVQFDSDKKKTIYLEISWKLRKLDSGQFQELKNSILDSDLVFDHNPTFLLNYYQSSIQLVPPQDKK